jgi:superfamily II DNA or RNA helicase
MPAVLTYKGVSMKWADFCRLPNYKKILKSLTIVTKIPIGRGKSVEKRAELYYRYRDRIMIARFAAFKLFSRIKNYIRDCKPIRIPTCELEYKPHQQAIYEHLMLEVYTDDKIAEGTAGCVLKLGTGMGKTFLAMGLIAEFSVKTLIVVPNEAILNQWVKCLTAVFPGMDIGKYYGKKKLDGDVIVMIANSTIAKDFIVTTVDMETKKKVKVHVSPIDYFSQFGFVVFDEIHKYPTPTLSGMFWRTCAGRMLGLTASPYSRKDKFDRVYFEHVGDLIEGEKVPGFSFDKVSFDVQVRTLEYTGPPEYTKQLTNANGITSTTKMIKQFAADPYRNTLLVNVIVDLFNAGRCIYIVAEHRDHLTELCGLLKCRDLVTYAPEISNVMGGSRAEELEAAKEHARILLTTYGYGTVGISIDRMDTLVLASPRVSYMDQVSGRIKRLGGDLSIMRIVVDLVDWKTSLKSQYYKRAKSFREENYSMEPKNRLRISWEDPRCNPEMPFPGIFW